MISITRSANRPEEGRLEPDRASLLDRAPHHRGAGCSRGPRSRARRRPRSGRSSRGCGRRAPGARVWWRDRSHSGVPTAAPPARRAGGTGRSRTPTARPAGSRPPGRGPSPVSMLRCGSGSSEPSSCSEHCMKTRFQYSKKRSFSPPGGPRRSRSRGPGRSRAPSTGRRARPGPACQKFSERGSRTIRSAGTPTERQHSIASSSGPTPSSSSPSKTLIQIRSGSRPKPWVESSQAHLDRPLLEVVAEREVARASRRTSDDARSGPPGRCRSCGSTSGMR